MIRALFLSVGIGALITTSATAHDDGITQKARQLGLAVGKTYTCVPEAERAVERADFEEMFDMFHHVDGKEVALVFAVAVGFGAAMEQSENTCTELMPLVNAVKAEMGLGGTK